MKKNLTLEELLGHVFDTFEDTNDAEMHSQKKAEFIFHMTDWSSDIETLAALYKDPNIMDRKSARQFLFGFLMHVIPHLNAAGRLLVGDVPDPFDPSKK